MPSVPLASDLGMERHHMILGTLGSHGGQVKRDREERVDIYSDK